MLPSSQTILPWFSAARRPTNRSPVIVRQGIGHQIDSCYKQSAWHLTGPHADRDPRGVPQLLPTIAPWELPKIVLDLIADNCGSVKYKGQEWEVCRLYQLQIFCLEELTELDLLTIIFAIITNLSWSLLKPASHQHLFYNHDVFHVSKHYQKAPEQNCLPQLFFWDIQQHRHQWTRRNF